MGFYGSRAIYDLLEQKVIPEFYARDESGVPTAWTERMRESMARLTPRFSANRAVREYTEQHYLPAAATYRGRLLRKAPSAGRWSIRSVLWKRNGPRCGSAK